MSGFIRKGDTFFENMREKRINGRNTWDNARLVLAHIPLNGNDVKKILFEENRDKILSAVSRRGTRVLEIRARRGETQERRIYEYL